MMNISAFKNKLVLPSSFLVAMSPSLAFAQSIDITGALATLGEVATNVALIGAAMIAIISAGIGFKWLLGFMIK